MGWKYKVLSVQFDEQSIPTPEEIAVLEAGMNEQGAAGWEIIQVQREEGFIWALAKQGFTSGAETALDMEPSGVSIKAADNSMTVKDADNSNNNYSGTIKAIVARASGGTYWGVDELMYVAGPNVMRLNHDPDMNTPGILREQQATNECHFPIDLSAPFLSGGWMPFLVRVTPDGIGPDGGAAYSINEKSYSITNNHYICHLWEGVLDEPTTCTFFVKKKPGGRDYGFVAICDSYYTTACAIIDLNTGVITDFNVSEWAYSGGGPLPSDISYRIRPAPNGYWRVSITATFPGPRGTLLPLIMAGPSDSGTPEYYFGIPTYISDGTIPGLWAWGAQCEARGHATSTILTNGVQGTRATDFISLPTAKFNWNSGANSVLMRFKGLGANPENILWRLSKSPTENNALLYGADLEAQIHSVTGGNDASVPFGTVEPSGQNIKTACAIADGDYAASLEGAAAVTGSLPLPEEPTMLELGGDDFAEGNILDFIQVPRRMANEELEESAS